MAMRKAGNTPTKRAAKKTTGRTTKKAATKVVKQATRKTAAKKAASTTARKKAAARKAVKKAAAKKAVRKAPARKRAVARKRITPEQALANTRQLLAAKHEHDRQPQTWHQFDPNHAPVPKPGFQSDAAASHAIDLHAGESRMKAIQGSISGQDRRHQGRQDAKG